MILRARQNFGIEEYQSVDLCRKQVLSFQLGDSWRHQRSQGLPELCSLDVARLFSQARSQAARLREGKSWVHMGPCGGVARRRAGAVEVLRYGQAEDMPVV